MKKILIIIAMLSFQCGVAQERFNGGFEMIDKQTRMPSGWLLNFNPGQEKAYKIQLDSVIKKQGAYALSIEHTGAGAEFAAIDFPINQIIEGDKVTLKGLIKTEKVNTGYAGFWMRFDEAQGKTFAFDNMQDKGLKGSNDWVPVSITLPYNAEKVISMHFGAIIVGDGKVWFDQLEILVNGKPLSQTKFKEREILNAEKDTSFRFSSGIKKTDLSKQQILNLTIAGQFWGFLKYHHPSIAKGDYNWDAELFRLLPQVLSSTTNKALTVALETFVDKLPKPALCVKCKTLPKYKFEINADYGSLLNGSVLAPSLTEKLNYIRENRSISEHYYLGFGSAGNPDFKNEKPYFSMTYPDAGYRLLALYRYWAMINYFFPYRDVIGEDWNQVLASSIPDFWNASDDTAYTLAALKIIVRIKDTHANIFSNRVLNNFKGIFAVPFQAKFIEKKLVITDLHTDTKDIKTRLAAGDVITSIDGVSVAELVKKFLPYTAASNDDTQLRNLPTDFLLRSNKDEIKLTIQRNGSTFDYNVPTASSRLAYKDSFFEKAEPYRILADNIAYVFPGKYKNSMLPDIKEKFSGAKGMIIDMRCYPSEFMPFTFGDYIKAEKSPFVKFTVGSLSHVGSFRFGEPLVNGGVGRSDKDHFMGNVVVIVNSTSQSQAEYTTMAFQSSKNVKVVGSTTSGADGNVSMITLPGGISTMISGIGVFYPNGDPSQRVGVKIDHTIYPTIKGIAAGRDELMEKAIEVLKKGW